jgi:hypothetical protein
MVTADTDRPGDASGEQHSTGRHTGPRADSVADRLAEALENAHQLDPIVERVAALWRGPLQHDGLRRLLRGKPLGHAAHPLLTDVPLGRWMSSAVLDAVGQEKAARRLIGAGILAAGPTVVTGWADWSVADDRTRRVGVVHAASNGVALACYTASWLARRKGNRGVGLLASAAGAAALGVGGFLGGHMAYVLGSPPRDPDAPVR